MVVLWLVTYQCPECDLLGLSYVDVDEARKGRPVDL